MNPGLEAAGVMRMGMSSGRVRGRRRIVVVMIGAVRVVREGRIGRRIMGLVVGMGRRRRMMVSGMMAMVEMREVGGRGREREMGRGRETVAMKMRVVLGRERER